MGAEDSLGREVERGWVLGECCLWLHSLEFWAGFCGRCIRLTWQIMILLRLDARDRLVGEEMEVGEVVGMVEEDRVDGMIRLLLIQNLLVRSLDSKDIDLDSGQVRWEERLRDTWQETEGTDRMEDELQCLVVEMTTEEAIGEVIRHLNDQVLARAQVLHRQDMKPLGLDRPQEDRFT